MLGKRFSFSLVSIALLGIALVSAGAWGGAVVARDAYDRIPDLQIALPTGMDSAGIYLADVSLDQALASGIGNRPGVLVAQVQCGALRRGDLITAIDGQQVATMRDLMTVVDAVAVGTPLSLAITRGGSQLNLMVARPTAYLPPAVEALLQPPLEPAPGPIVETTLQQWWGPGLPNPGLVLGVISGVQVENLTANAVEALGLSPTAVGVLVSGIEDQAPASLAGLRTNDVIVEVNSIPVFSVADFQKTIGATGSNSVTLRVNRRGSVIYVMIPVQP